MRNLMLFFGLAVTACSRKETSKAAVVVHRAPMRGGSLGERLVQESKAHPEAALKADAVYSALEKNGFGLKERKQYLASPVGAAYCLAADSDADLAFTVCEYESDAAAEKGRIAALQASRAAAAHEIFVHHATTLTLWERPKGESSAKSSALAQSTFSRL